MVDCINGGDGIPFSFVVVILQLSFCMDPSKFVMGTRYGFEVSGALALCSVEIDYKLDRLGPMLFEPLVASSGLPLRSGHWFGRIVISCFEVEQLSRVRDLRHHALERAGISALS